MNPTKTRIVYCKDDKRKGNHPDKTFDFLGYTFRPRKVRSESGTFFIGFTPAVSKKAKKAMQQEIRGWRLQLKTDKALEDLSRMYNPKIRGWDNYYGRFCKSEMYSVYRHFNHALVRWVIRKYKKLANNKRRRNNWLGNMAKQEPQLFRHWQMGILPGTE